MDTWSIEYHDKVAVLTFTRPPKNTMDFTSIRRLGDHLESLAKKTDEVKVVMLTGGVDGYFIAHADLADLASNGRGESTEADLEGWDRALRLLEEIPQPTIAAIDGQAWGGGNETALACTLRIGSERAHVGNPEVLVGIIPGGGGTIRLPRLVGPGVAADAIIAGRVFKAQEALQHGWLNAVLPTEGFRESAIEWAQNVARHPGDALFAAKKAIVEGLKLPQAEGLKLERKLFNEISATSSLLQQKGSEEA
ncbi:enoyl-CoA hydratase/isomerase family protein [Priestia megaterium]|nr:enoyl-CoA hydratase/isomerase family protein [Priestia megaterium]